MYIEDRERGQKRKVIVQVIHGEALTKAVEEDGQKETSLQDLMIDWAWVKCMTGER